MRFVMTLLWFGLALLSQAAVAAEEPPLLIGGAIVAADRVIPNGWILLREGKIVSISEAKPAARGARVIATHDIVFPGLIDLHNHPLYAVFPRWKAPKVYPNRYEWRTAQAYWDAIQTPEGKLVTSHFCDMDAYVEFKALAGGTTSLLGIYRPADTSTIPATGFYGTEIGHERAGNILGVRPNDLKLSAETLELIKRDALDLVAVHLGEGQRNDADSHGEFARLKDLGLLTPKTTIIHGVALTESDFGEIAAAGASFIWSPRSNFELYGETADIAAALRQKVTMALAPDWSPTGSTNMLAEIAYAKAVIDRQFKGLISTQQLFEMATAVPARIAKIDDKVGSLAPGLYADLFIVRGDTTKPFDTLASAKPQDVSLVVINGVPIYGAKDYLEAAGASAAETVTLCGQAKAISSKAIPGKFADITARLTVAMAAEKLTLAGLAECP